MTLEECFYDICHKCDIIKYINKQTKKQSDWLTD
jgi:hypothetical protein